MKVINEIDKDIKKQNSQYRTVSYVFVAVDLVVNLLLVVSFYSL